MSTSPQLEAVADRRNRPRSGASLGTSTVLALATAALTLASTRLLRESKQNVGGEERERERE